MNIFWTVIVIILVLWLLGFGFGVMGGLVHLLLIVALIAVIVKFLT